MFSSFEKPMGGVWNLVAEDLMSQDIMSAESKLWTVPNKANEQKIITFYMCSGPCHEEIGPN